METKPFIIRCAHCRWAQTSTGISTDLSDLTEIQSGCSNCGAPRKFKCPKCGKIAKMTRVRCA